MTIRSPMQQRNRGCLILSLFVAGLIAAAALAFAGFSFYTANNTSSTSSGIGVTTTSDGEQIGISDGTYTFDTHRADGNLKLQAADAFKRRDIIGAESLWKQALAVKDESNDAEALIYLEDQQVIASHDPYITFVIGTMLTGGKSNVSTGRDNLQGAYVAQKEYNDGLKLNGVRVRLLIANAGSQPAYATTVALQIVQAAQSDHTIVGMMGWPFSAYALNAVSVLSNAHIPMVSPTASSDKLIGISHFFFRVVPSNKSQAIAGAKYAEQQLHAQRVALFVDPANAYSSTLAADFRQQFTADGNQIVATERYTVGQPKTLPVLLQDAMNTNPTPDLIYFAGYADDMGVLLTDLPPNVQVMGGDALYELGGYPSSARAGFERLHFTAFAYPDEWMYLNQPQPAFFTIYGQDFDPNRQHTGSPYSYTRPDNDVILSYDAMLALLQGSKNALTGGKTSLTAEALQQSLTKITGSQGIQGISGQISFAADGDPINKAIVVLYVSPEGFIRLAGNNAIRNCFLLGQCSNS